MCSNYGTLQRRVNALWHVKVRNCCKTSYTSSVVVMCNVFWPFRSRTSRVGRTCRSSTDAKTDACRQHEGDEQQKCGETGGETSTSRTTSRKGEAARKTQLEIGRCNARLAQSIWHNPFEMGCDGSRQDVFTKFADYLWYNNVLQK